VTGAGAGVDRGRNRASGARARARRRAVSLVEALLVAAVLATLGLPLLALIQTGSREGALSEDFMFAEVLASRLLEEWAGQPFRRLDDLVPRTVVVGSGSAGGAPAAAASGDRTRREALAAPAGFDAVLEIVRVRDGLLGLEVTVSWDVPRERSRRRFALTLLKSDPARSLEATWRL
jgi:hypothetical protein